MIILDNIGRVIIYKQAELNDSFREWSVYDRIHTDKTNREGANGKHCAGRSSRDL